MSKSNALEAGYLDLLFLNTDFANVGDAGGLRGSVTAGSLFASLHTAYQGEGGSQNTSEATYTPYVRQAIVRSGSGFTRSGNAVSNVAAVNFPQCTGLADDQTMFFWGIGTAVSGAGVLLYLRHIGPAAKIFNALASNDTFTSFAHGLVVDARVVFYAPDPSSGGVLPTGVTEGTVYFVRTVPTADTFTISTTQGGATVDLTTDGCGWGGRVNGVRITNLIQPVIAIGQQIIAES